ncbi:MAG: hypothetical protein HY063_02340 [Bacteroidetes bacterium]|nr:hypothetical protein [Bacteroidota bacterium]
MFAQTVDDYFHSSAQLFIHGKKNEAKQRLQEAIQKYPSDTKLRGLLAKIKDDEKKNNQDQNQDNSDSDKNKNQNKNKDQKKDKQKEKQQQEQQQNISKEDAQRLLEAMNNDEKKLRDKMNEKRVKVASSQIEKDW